MTLIGMYNFLEYQEIDLFQKLSLPTGIDKDVCIQNILMQCDDKELLYPDSAFMIDAIGMWSTKWARTFQKWIDVLSLEYNPIENYDRKEGWTDSTSTSESMSSSESNSASASDSATNSNFGETSAFNVSTYSPESKAEGNTHAASTSNANSAANEERTSYNQSGHNGRIHGNIGVTTTQQMIESEIELDRFNIYNEIALIFMREFVLAL